MRFQPLLIGSIFNCLWFYQTGELKNVNRVLVLVFKSVALMNTAQTSDSKKMKISHYRGLSRSEAKGPDGQYRVSYPQVFHWGCIAIKAFLGLGFRGRFALNVVVFFYSFNFSNRKSVM